ncbi:calcitonin gene-related peptide type 1 receptor isoform X2 [Dermatophagoides farinae]|uniref:calcitonin gene-related peptide type 1 receptor isoform X2 n=2 Tax=Dermatophagoides farinae TaxID=6954 RepID=UPI003F5DD90D
MFGYFYHHLIIMKIIINDNNRNRNKIQKIHHSQIYHHHWKYVKHKCIDVHQRHHHHHHHHHCNYHNHHNKTLSFHNLIILILLFCSSFHFHITNSLITTTTTIDHHHQNHNHHHQHQHQHHQQQHHHHSYYYLKPSNFFNEYFDCRFGLIMTELRKLSINNADDDEINDEKIMTTTTTTTNNNSKRNSETDNNFEIESTATTTTTTNCPADCDGITMWPETKRSNVHYIFCYEILKNLHERTAFSVVGGDGGNLISDETNENSENHHQNNDWTLLSDQNDFAHHNHHPRQQQQQQQQHHHNHHQSSSSSAVAAAKVSRYCNDDGIWESSANYSTCGLDNDKLFLLTTNQLQKIFEIRERMIHSKFTQNKESEQAFIDCIDNVLSLPPSNQLAKPFCERTFDGWTCFNDTPAGEVSYFSCPDFVYGFNPQNQAHKTCTKEGKWRVHHETHVPWTNYTSCVDIPDFHFRNMIIKLHIVGYSISLVALLISLTIFVSFKTLSSQTRIRIHKNLFVSFIINNFMWIVWYLVIRDGNILFENGFPCQALHVVLHYFLVCNYFWMFCEGLYLHTILVIAFVSEEKILKWFYMIGWAIPIIFVSAYATFRAFSSDTKNCWIDESPYLWILNIPVIISFVLNTFFLINIVRVLVTKLQAVNTADAHHTRKAVRATLILIPLLGLHFILTPFRPETNDSAARAYEIFSAIVLSLQGFCVSILFCYFNGEVLTVVKKKWNQFLLVHGYTSNNNNQRITSHHGTEISLVDFFL